MRPQPFRGKFGRGNELATTGLGECLLAGLNFGARIRDRLRLNNACHGEVSMFSRYILLTIAALIAARADAQLFAPPTAPNQIVVDATNVLSQSVAMQNGLP